MFAVVQFYNQVSDNFKSESPQAMPVGGAHQHHEMDTDRLRYTVQKA